MDIYDADTVAARLPYAALIDALDSAFREGVHVPARAHHTIEKSDRRDGTLLLMPAWRDGGGLGVKIATVFPDNRDSAAVQANYFLLDGDTGVPQAVIEGRELTLRRTAAASALASRYLSRTDSATMLMIGTGQLAPHLIAAHQTVRPIDRVLVWGRSQEKAQRLAAKLKGAVCEPVPELAAAVAEADIISSATLSAEPLIHGRWLHGGQHLDLVGAFTPEMRETDSETVARSSVFVDTYDGALQEAGDIVQAVRDGTISEDDVAADLAELTRVLHAGRKSAAEITLFKSVGTALEDLVAAELVVRG